MFARKAFDLSRQSITALAWFEIPYGHVTRLNLLSFPLRNEIVANDYTLRIKTNVNILAVKKERKKERERPGTYMEL